MSSVDRALRGSGRSPWPVWLLGCLVVYALLLGAHGGPVLAGNLANSDDMMRMLQVRGLLDGAPWHDVDQPRFLSPEGGEMHWSRLPDILIATLVLIAQPFLGRDGAEIFAALVYPGLILSGLILTTLFVVRRTGGGLFAQVFVFIAVSGFAPIFQFWPGRIDHHGLNALLAIGGLSALTAQRRQVVWALTAGLIIAVMVSIAAETLPMAVTLIAGAGLLWVIRGGEDRLRLAAFGAALSLSAIVLTFADAPGWSAERDVCDAMGWSHLSAFLITGAAFVLLGLGGAAFRSWQARLIAGLSAGVACISLVLLLVPDCLGDPYGAVSDEVRTGWLSIVSEAQSLPAKFADAPAVAVFYIGVALTGLPALAWLLLTETGRRRETLAVLGFMLLLSILVTAWQVRAMIFAQTLALIPLSLAAGRGFARWQRVGGAGPLLAAAATAVALSPHLWRYGTPIIFPAATPAEPASAGSDTPERAAPLRQRDCQSSASLAPLNALPEARVFTPIDLGAPVMFQTGHSVFVAPYHRNLGAIDRALEVWTGPLADARAELFRLDADYIVFCDILPETRRYARTAPGSLSARLQEGPLPGWLEPADESETLSIYRVRTPRQRD